MKNSVLTILSFLFIYSAIAQTDSADFYYHSGVKKYDLKLFSSARLDFDKAIALNPSFTKAYVEGGKTDAKTGRTYEAGQKFEKAYALEPNNPEMVELMMNWNFQNRQFAKAVEFAVKCKCQGAAKVIGVSSYYIEDYGQAEQYLKKAVKYNPDDAEINYMLGQTYMELDKWPPAISYYQKAVGLQPEKGFWQYELAILLYNTNDFTNALKYFDGAIAGGYPENLDFMENKGFCLLYAGKLKEGEDMLQKVMDRKPNNGSLMRDVAYALYDTKNFKEAVGFFDKALALNPQDANSMFMSGVSLIRLGHDEKGKALCEKAIRIDPSLAKNRQEKKLPMGF